VTPAVTIYGVVSPTDGYPAEVPFVGREAESALVAITLDRDPVTLPTQLVVWGEPGIGKTRLLREAAAKARSHSKHIVWIEGNPVEARVPYGAVSVALSRQPGVPEDLRADLEQARAALDVELAADATERKSFGRACSTLTSFLSHLAKTAPVAIVVDDLQLLDQESLALLDVLLSRLRDEIGFVCTVRAFPYPLTSRPGELLSRVRDGGRCDDIHLGSLGAQQVSMMLENLCGAAVRAETAEFVASRASGNPLFVLEIGRSLIRYGTAESGGMPAGIADLPPSHHSAVLQRIYPLPVEARLFAQVTSVLRRLSLDQLGMVGEIAGLDPKQAAGAFDELERNGILLTDGSGHWSFFHPFVADALYEDLGTAERKRIHRQIADGCHIDLDTAAAADVLELAWHLLHSAEIGDRFAVEVLVRAARLTRTFAPESAADYCRKALRLLSPSSPGRSSILALQARCHIIANRNAEALAAGLASLEGLPPGRERIRAVNAVVGTLFDLGRVHEAIALADQEAAAGSTSSFLEAQRATLRAALGDVDVSRLHLAEALSNPNLPPGEAVLVYSHGATHAGLAGPVADVVKWLDRALDAGRNADESMSKYALSRAEWTLAAYGFVTAAADLTERGKDEGASLEASPGPYPAGFDLGRLLTSWLTGDWDGALSGIESARRTVDESANQPVAGELRRCEAEMRAWRGELREALALTNQPSIPGSASATAWVTGGALRSLGDLDAAESVLAAGADRPDSAVWFPHVLSRLIEVQAETGRTNAAAANLQVLCTSCSEEHDPRPWAQSLLWRARAVVERSAAAAATAARIAEGEGLVFEMALARLLQAELDPTETLALQHAHRVFSSLGVDGLRRRTAALLRERDVQVPRRRRRQPGALTETEASIARMVQMGMRNREIASALHYSERTVEVYLSRIYAIVGVSSRMQLARLLDEGEPSGPGRTP
jgi:DNA-binding CsgD family transcriptional regulator